MFRRERVSCHELEDFMSDNRIISFIHEIRSLDRKWKNLTADQKRAVLSNLDTDIDEKHILKAIRKVRRAK